MLNHDRRINAHLMIFDVLRVDGTDVTMLPYRERRNMLEQLELNGLYWTSPDAFDDGDALSAAVCEHALEGVVAKWRRSLYRPGQRGWITTKNPRLLAARQ